VIRRVLGALLGRTRSPTPAAAPAPTHPLPLHALALDALALDAAALRAHGGTCLDVRPSEALAAGIVAGAWVLPAADALRLAHALPADLVVLAATDADAITLAEAFVAAGRPNARASVGGIVTWVTAGRPVHEPAWKSPLPPGHAVVLDDGRPGWIQDVRWPLHEFRFDVLVVSDGALVRVADLTEERLVSQGARGAAGLGSVV
jgi:rhodanese-related sulfurtransferase